MWRPLGLGVRFACVESKPRFGTEKRGTGWGGGRDDQREDENEAEVPVGGADDGGSGEDWTWEKKNRGLGSMRGLKVIAECQKRPITPDIWPVTNSAMLSESSSGPTLKNALPGTRASSVCLQQILLGHDVSKKQSPNWRDSQIVRVSLGSLVGPGRWGRDGP